MSIALGVNIFNSWNSDMIPYTEFTWFNLIRRWIESFSNQVCIFWGYFAWRYANCPVYSVINISGNILKYWKPGFCFVLGKVTLQSFFNCPIKSFDNRTLCSPGHSEHVHFIFIHQDSFDVRVFYGELYKVLNCGSKRSIKIISKTLLVAFI